MSVTLCWASEREWKMSRAKMVTCVIVAALIGIGGFVTSRAVGADKKEGATMSRAGGCFCGAVRYEITGPLVNQTVCHCLGCKRSSGAGALPWITVKTAGFKVTQGTLAEVRSNKFPKATCDGHGGVRTFCSKCGTPISFKGDGRADKEVDITVGSLDNPKDFSPTEDVFAEQRLAWIKPVK